VRKHSREVSLWRPRGREEIERRVNVEQRRAKLEVDVVVPRVHDNAPRAGRHRERGGEAEAESSLHTERALGSEVVSAPPVYGVRGVRMRAGRALFELVAPREERRAVLRRGRRQSGVGSTTIATARDDAQQSFPCAALRPTQGSESSCETVPRHARRSRVMRGRGSHDEAAALSQRRKCHPTVAEKRVRRDLGWAKRQ
jgi:hypothetical protein